MTIEQLARLERIKVAVAGCDRALVRAADTLLEVARGDLDVDEMGEIAVEALRDMHALLREVTA